MNNINCIEEVNLFFDLNFIYRLMVMFFDGIERYFKRFQNLIMIFYFFFFNGNLVYFFVSGCLQIEKEENFVSFEFLRNIDKYI